MVFGRGNKAVFANLLPRGGEITSLSFFHLFLTFLNICFFPLLPQPSQEHLGVRRVGISLHVVNDVTVAPSNPGLNPTPVASCARPWTEPHRPAASLGRPPTSWPWSTRTTRCPPPSTSRAGSARSRTSAKDRHPHQRCRRVRPQAGYGCLSPLPWHRGAQHREWEVSPSNGHERGDVGSRGSAYFVEWDDTT